MAFLRTAAILFVVQLRALLTSKRGLLCLVLALGPTLLAFVVRTAAEANDAGIPVFEVGWMMIAQAVVPLIALILGAAVVSEEVDDRTITFLFTRPIPRAGVLFGRLLAALLVVEVLIFLSAESSMAVLNAAENRKPWMVMPEGMSASLRDTCLIGGLIYTSLFAVVGVLFKHAMIIGIGYTFVIEGFVAQLPGKNPAITVQYYLRSRLAGGGEAFAERMSRMVGEQDLLPADEAQRTLWILLCVSLALGTLVISRKQYVLPS